MLQFSNVKSLIHTPHLQLLNNVKNISHIEFIKDHVVQNK